MTQRLRVGAGDVAQKGEIHELDEVAVFAAILDAGCLVLVIVVLQRLRKPHRRQIRFDEGAVVAAAPQAIQSEDEADRVHTGDLFDRAREVPRRGVHAVRSPAGEEARPARAAGRRVGAHDVVVQESADGVALLLQELEQALAAEQSLLLP